MADLVLLEMRVLRRGQYEASGETLWGSVVAEPSPPSLDRGRFSNVRSTAGGGGEIRRSGATMEAVRGFDGSCSSNLGVLRSVCVLPEELDGREGMRDGC